MEPVIIEIKGVIDSWGYTSGEVRYMLAKHKGEAVVCRVNSYGGDVNEALAIAQAFADHGDVTVHLLAFNASAATFMVYGAKRVLMADDGLWLCHRCSVTVDIWKDMNLNDVNAAIEQLKSQAKSQEAIDLMIAQKYLDHAAGNGKKHTMEDILALMNEERWMPAAEAAEMGFVDGVIKNAKSVSKNAEDFLRATAVNLHLPVPPAAMERPEKEGLLKRMGRFLGIGQAEEGNDGKEGTEPAEPTKPTEPNKPTETNEAQTAQSAHESQSSHESQASQASQDSNTPKTIRTMKKNYKNLLALLALEGLGVGDDGKVVITEEQLDTIEARLAQASKDAAVINDTAQALDGVSETVKGIDGLRNKALAVVGILNRMPLAAPAGTGKVPEEDPAKVQADAIKKHAVDPVNAEAAAFARG